MILLQGCQSIPASPKITPAFLKGLDPPLVHHDSGDVVFTYAVQEPFEPLASSVRDELQADGWKVEESHRLFASYSKSKPAPGVKRAVVVIGYGAGMQGRLGRAYSFPDPNVTTLRIYETREP